MQKIIVKNKNDMSNLAKKIASAILPNSVIALKGTLGAGKSFFAKEFINEIQNEKTEILSPTFNLVYSYNTNHLLANLCFHQTIFSNHKQQRKYYKTLQLSPNFSYYSFGV